MSHSNAPKSSPLVHIQDVAPFLVIPSLPPPPARPHLPAPPTHASRLPHPTFTPNLTLPPQPLSPSYPPVSSQKIFEQTIQQSVSLHSFMEAKEKIFITQSSNSDTTNSSSTNSSWPCKNNRWTWLQPFCKTNLPPQQHLPLLWYQPHQ